MKRVLCSLTINQDFVEFAIPQLKAILNSFPVPLQQLLSQQLQGRQYTRSYEINHDKFTNFPFIILNVPNFQQNRSYACKKSVMVNKMILLIASGNNYEELFSNPDQQILFEECRNDNDLVMCDFTSRNRIMERADQIQRIHKVLGGFNIKGKINFKTPNKRYQLIQQHEWYHDHHKTELAATLKKIFFGIELCTNKIAKAKFNSQYELNKRIYLGPTSTDNDLAFMMCRQGLVAPGSLVFDPFVGTGGLLIPPASIGAITFGSDLDIRVLNGYSVGRINKKSPFYHQDKKLELFTPKITLNFEQYGLPIPNIFRIDSTKLNLRQTGLFDAIITDPPYGIRAMSRSVNSKADEEEEKLEQKQQEIRQIIESAKFQKNQQKQALDENNQQQDKDSKSGSESGEQKTAEQKERKRQWRKVQKQNKKKRRDALPEQEKQFKKDILSKLNRQRVDLWQKFDRNKIETTQREKIFYGLLRFARRYLRKGGRLVFLYPIYKDEEYLGVKSLPPYEGFSVVDLSQNKMSQGNSRILVTLQKL